VLLLGLVTQVDDTLEKYVSKKESGYAFGSIGSEIVDLGLSGTVLNTKPSDTNDSALGAPKGAEVIT
jgi:hypothetical protein